MFGLNPVTAATIAGAFVFGMVLALLGSIKLALAKRLGIDEVRVGGLLSSLQLALIPMMLLTGLLIDKLGGQMVLAVGAVVAAVGLLTLTWGRGYRAALGSVLVIGLGGAAVSAASVVLMPKAFGPLFKGSEVIGALNLGNVFIGLGALMMPTLADLLLRTLGFRWTMVVLAVLCLVPGVLALLTPASEFLLQDEQGGVVKVLLNPELWSNPILWLSAGVFFFYAPVEFAIGFWATTYLTEHRYREHHAAWLLSGFWLAFLASRLLVAYLGYLGIPPWVSPALLILLGILMAVALGNLAGASSRGNAALGLLLLGLAMGPVFPTVLGIVFDALSPKHYGAAYGTVFGVGSLGSLILAPVIGIVARSRGVQPALRIPMALALLLSGAALVLGLVNLTMGPTH
jgi:fucose permease